MTKKILTHQIGHLIRIGFAACTVTLMTAVATHAGVVHNSVALPINIQPKTPPETPYIREGVQVIRKLNAENFEALNSEADFYLTNKSRGADGRWRLSEFFSTLSSYFSTTKKNTTAWTLLQKQLLNNALKNSKSQGAWLMHASALDAEAWRIRGDGYNNTTTSIGRARFLRLLEAQRKVLDGHTELFVKNPEWYKQRMEVALYLSEGREKIDQLFQSGIQVERDYHDLYHVAMFTRLPKWGGSIDLMAQFLDQVANNPSPREGISMYSLLMIDNLNAAYELRKDPRVSWDLMKKSFDDVLANFPDDQHSQKFFIAACEKGDKATAVRMSKFVKHAPSSEILGKNVEAFNSCFEWAFNNALMYSRDPNTGAGVLIK